VAGRCAGGVRLVARRQAAASGARYNAREFTPLRRARFPMKKYMCLICGWIYDEAEGAPDEGIAPGTRWEDVPPNWTCPECGARKEDFEMIEF
jgi:rubredoxin